MSQAAVNKNNVFVAVISAHCGTHQNFSFMSKRVRVSCRVCGVSTCDLAYVCMSCVCDHLLLNRPWSSRTHIALAVCSCQSQSNGQAPFEHLLVEPQEA